MKPKPKQAAKPASQPKPATKSVAEQAAEQMAAKGNKQLDAAVAKPLQTAAKDQPKTKTKRRAQASSKVNWQKAKQWYLDDVTRSYADTAKEFGVSKWAVEQHSSKDPDGRWSVIRQDIGESNTTEFIDKKKTELEELNNTHLLIYRNLRNAGNSIIYDLEEQRKKAKTRKGGATIDSRAYGAATGMIKAGIEGERVIKGLPILIAKSETAEPERKPVSPAQAKQKMQRALARAERLGALRAKQNQQG